MRKYYLEDVALNPAILYQSGTQSGFTEVTDQVILTRLINQTYYQRSVDGKEWYNNFRSRRFIDYLAVTITEGDYDELEDTLQLVALHLNMGQWRQAKDHLLSLSYVGLYDAAMEISISGEMTTYITNNY